MSRLFALLLLTLVLAACGREQPPQETEQPPAKGVITETVGDYRAQRDRAQQVAEEANRASIRRVEEGEGED